MVHLAEQLFLDLLDALPAEELVLLRVPRRGPRLGFALRLVLHKVAEGVLVVLPLLHIEDVGVGVAAAIFDPFPREDRVRFLPLILVQGLDLLFLVVQLVLDLNIDSVVVVDRLRCLFALALSGLAQRYLQLSNRV